MREKELLKIALQGDFNVIKISKNEEGFYILCLLYTSDAADEL